MTIEPVRQQAPADFFRRGYRAFVIVLSIVAAARAANAQTDPEVQKLADQVRQLQQKVADLEQQIASHAPSSASTDAAASSPNEKPHTDAPSAPLQPVTAPVTSEPTHNFVVAGYGSGLFSTDLPNNSFNANLNPIFLFSVRPRLLFEGELEIKLVRDAGTGQSSADFGLEYAQGDWLVNKYATVVFGKFLTPFGDFIEHRHPSWINPLVTFPLPLREGDEGGLLLFSDLGLQVRGAVPLGEAGGVLDYSVYGANGPSYDSTAPGASLQENFIDNNKNKAFGARVGFRPFSWSSAAGSLRVGFSTLNGRWDDRGHFWLHANGVDVQYQKSAFSLRGEYIHTGRQTSSASDDRSGWYGEAAYSLRDVTTQRLLSRLETVYRFSDQDQAGLHARQHAFGVDYWISRFVVWKLEYDRQRLHGDTPYGNAFATQLAFGF